MSQQQLSIPKGGGAEAGEGPRVQVASFMCAVVCGRDEWDFGTNTRIIVIKLVKGILIV